MADKAAGTPFQDSGKKKARIEIIPLIDVIFFLLATFVLFTLSLNKIQSIEAKVPVSEPPKTQTKPEEPFVLQVSEGDIVYIDKVARGQGDVYSALMQYKDSQTKNGKIARVLITGDDSAKYNSLIRVLDEVKAAGITEMSFEAAYRPPGK